MVIDAHTHLGLNEFCDDGTEVFEYELQNNPDDFIRFMDNHGISKAVVLPIPGNNYNSKLSNNYLFEAMVKYPGRFIPFCKLDGDLAINLMCRSFYGAKYHMVYEKYSKRELTKYYKEMEYYGFPLIVHANFKNKSKQIHNILSIAPKLQIIVAHMGRGHIYTDEMVYDLIDEFKGNTNVYFETSTVGRIQVIEYACKTIGSNRLMFGTDYPFGKAWFKNMYDYNDEVEPITEASISVDDKYNLLCGTILSIAEKCDECRKQFFVRPIIPNDVEIMLRKISNLTKDDIKLLALEKKMGLLKNCIRKCNHVYVALFENEIVGFFRESGRANNSYMLEEIVVFNEFRGNGYSKKIMDYFIKFFPNAFAKTHANNVKINSLLSEYGFEQDNGKRIINWTRNDRR